MPSPTPSTERYALSPSAADTTTDLRERARSLKRLGYNWRAVGWMLGGLYPERAQALAEGEAVEPLEEPPLLQLALVIPDEPKPVDMCAPLEAPSVGPTLVTPAGYRVEGLDLSSLALLLEHLG